jgi:hypothetical protein
MAALKNAPTWAYDDFAAVNVAGEWSGTESLPVWPNAGVYSYHPEGRNGHYWDYAGVLAGASVGAAGSGGRGPVIGSSVISGRVRPT